MVKLFDYSTMLSGSVSKCDIASMITDCSLQFTSGATDHTASLSNVGSDFFIDLSTAPLGQGLYKVFCNLALGFAPVETAKDSIDITVAKKCLSVTPKVSGVSLSHEVHQASLSLNDQVDSIYDLSAFFDITSAFPAPDECRISTCRILNSGCTSAPVYDRVEVTMLAWPNIAIHGFTDLLVPSAT